MSKGCLKCGTENADDARFCRGCGANLISAPAAPPEAVAADQPCRACGHLNRASARFCAKCGADQAPPAFVAAPAATSKPPAPSSVTLVPSADAPRSTLPAALAPAASADASRPMALWIGIGTLVVGLIGGGAWWLTHARSAAVPTFDSAPPPSVLAASGTNAAMPAASEAPPGIATSASDPPRAAATAAPAPSTLWEPAGKETVIIEGAEQDPPKEPAKSPTKQASKEPSKDKAARDAKAKALREQRAQAASQAEADLARRRAEDARARAVQAAAAPVPAPVSRTAAPAPVSTQARSVQERCANHNPLAQGICESRECARADHAGEAVCQRIKAADDRRREQ